MVQCLRIDKRVHTSAAHGVDDAELNVRRRTAGRRGEYEAEWKIRMALPHTRHPRHPVTNPPSPTPVSTPVTTTVTTPVTATVATTVTAPVATSEPPSPCMRSRPWPMTPAGSCFPGRSHLRRTSRGMFTSGMPATKKGLAHVRASPMSWKGRNQRRRNIRTSPASILYCSGCFPTGT